MVNFPDHYINPQKKGSDWILEMARAIHKEWGSQSTKSFEKGGNRYALNKLYSLGKQPIDAYRPVFEVEDDKDSSYINLDFSPPAIIPKFKRIIINKFAKIDFSIDVQAIDPYALDDKRRYEATEMANIKMRQILDEVGLDSDIFNSGEVDQPKDEEELAIKMDFGYKHNQAIDVEKKIDAVFTHEKFDQILEVVRSLAFDTGVYAVKVDTTDNGKVCIEFIDAGTLIVSPTKDPYFRDIWYAGTVKLVTIDNVRRGLEQEGIDFDEDELYTLARKHSGEYGNPEFFSKVSIGGTTPYDSYKIPVFDFEFISCDRCWYEKRWDKRGNAVIGKVDKPRNKKDRKYMNEDKSVVYKGKWIIDSDTLIYDSGLKSDIVLDKDVEGNLLAQLSFKIIAPELNAMETSPIVENFIPDVDQITIAWYKLQNVVARARPKGIMIEIGALEDISLGGEGKEAMRPIDVLDLFTQTGLLVYRKISLDGTPSNYKPIEELTNGLGTEAQEYFAVIQAHINSIKEKIGVNDVTDGSTPNPKMLNGVASMLQEATNNALHHLHTAEKALIESTAHEVAIRVYDSIRFKKKSPYKNVTSSEGLKSVGENDTSLLRQFTTAIEYGTDAFEKERLQMRIEKEMDAGRITLADATAVERCRNVKQAEQILAYRIKKNLEKQQQDQERLAMVNAEANTQAAVAAEEEKRKTLALQTELKLSEIIAEKEAKAELMQMEYQLKGIMVDAPARQTKIDTAKIAAQSAREVAQIKSSTPNLSAGL